MSPSYLQAGYFDPEGILMPELVSREKLLRIVNALSNASPRLTNHQLRRFFQHCRAIETRLKSGQSTWEHERSSFMKLDFAADDAFGKSPKKIPALFHAFIVRNVNAVATEKDFREGFLSHFEALVGFSSGKLKERD